MMKKLMIVAVCAMAVMMSCKNKGQNAAAEGADSDSVVIDSVLAEMPDTAPRPMFLYVQDKEHMQMVYWMTSIRLPSGCCLHLDFSVEYTISSTRVAERRRMQMVVG